MKPSHHFFAFLLSTVAFHANALPTVAFDQSTLSAELGDTFELVLRGSGFDTTLDGKIVNNVTGGQSFDLSFGATTLKLVDVQIASRWVFAAGNKTGVIDNDAGTLTGLAFGTFPATTDDSFDIATLRFEAVGPGSTDLIVSGGTFAARVDSISGSAITPVFEPTNVSVMSAVPEADSWAMMLAGLGMLGWHARRRLTT